MYRLSGARITGPLEKLYIEQHFLYFRNRHAARYPRPRRPGGRAPAARAHGSAAAHPFTPPVRLALRALFGVAPAITGLENRLFALARAAGAR